MALIFLVGFLSFGLGRLSIIKEGREGIKVEFSPEILTGAAGSIPNASQNSDDKNASESEFENVAAKEGKYVGSKSGSKYHLPWCSGAQRIKKENEVWFDSKEEAAKAGYTPAANCPGL
ncbi:MAG: hypothetical protein Q8P52_00980 [bacterium]|nr:hypothetical protein [bacterium]